MSAMKDYLLEVQELVVEAMLSGAKTDNDLFAFVQMYVPEATEGTVKYIAQELFEDNG
jgi:hypothetical protein